MSIAAHIQGANLGGRVTLFRLDLSMFSLEDVFLAPGTDEEPASAISFGGQVYAPHPVQAEGFETTTDGPLPRPTFTVSNLDNSFTAIVEENDDLQGALLHRIRTFSRYLDGHEEPDGNVHLPIETYQLARKTKHNRDVISWECTATMDQEGVRLPGRQIVRDYCDHTYRRWTGAAFDYTNVTCPYVDLATYDEDGNACPPADDRCSKLIGTGCRVRFGQNAVLPTRAFPGVARLKLR